MFSTHHDSRLSPVIAALKPELRRPVHRWPVTRASAFAPTSHGIKSSVRADWRDHAGANQLTSRPRSISRQLRDWSGPYSCPAFGGKCRTRDDSKGRLVVFLVRISKIYTSGIRIRTNQECFGDQPNRACFHTSKTVLSHIF